MLFIFEKKSVLSIENFNGFIFKIEADK